MICIAQTHEEKNITAATQNNNNHEIKFRDLNTIYTGSEFDYRTITREPNFWEKLKKSILNFLFPSTENVIVDQKREKTVYLILWSLALIALLIIFALLVRNKKFIKLFKSENETIEWKEDIIENIQEIDFEQQIKTSEAQNDYQLAIRYRFLEILKILDQENIIRWQAQKTNIDYILEWQQESNKLQFKNICNWYDYVWYGDFPIDTALYEHISKHMTHFKKTYRFEA